MKLSISTKLVRYYSIYRLLEIHFIRICFQSDENGVFDTTKCSLPEERYQKENFIGRKVRFDPSSRTKTFKEVFVIYT